MLYFILIVITIVFLDQYSKFLILEYVEIHGLSERDYITSGNNIIDLTYATNIGAAFGLFPGQQRIFIIITFIALLAILIYIIRSKELTRFPMVGLAFIFGGAIGNLIDRLRYGKVIDFIDIHWRQIYHWPTFNLADAAICIGVAILFIDMFWIQNKSATQREEISK